MPSSATYPTDRSPRRPANRTLTVCVVDPQAADYQGWESLNLAGVELTFVADAAQALKFARTRPVDLWVVNAELAGLTGFDLCRMLKAHNYRTTVYLVANEYTPAMEQAAWQARATIFGCKPSHMNWLREWFEAQQERGVSRPVPSPTAAMSR